MGEESEARQPSVSIPPSCVVAFENWQLTPRPNVRTVISTATATVRRMTRYSVIPWAVSDRAEEYHRRALSMKDRGDSVALLPLIVSRTNDSSLPLKGGIIAFWRQK